MEAIASKKQGKFAQNIQSKNSSNKAIMGVLANKNRVQNTQNINQENLEICKICGEPTQYLVNIPLMNKRFLAHINCRCERKKLEIQRENEIKQEKLSKIAELKNLSLISKRYENVSFESTQTGHNSSFDKAFERCKRYCENHQKVYENGNGIYLFGAKGSGKTHLTACIANELLKKCVPVLLTNLFEISKAIKSTFQNGFHESEQEFFERFEKVSFLIFDDLGVETFTKNDRDTWLQTLLFDLINRRYNAKKPTIFSSNYSLNELVNLRGIADRTIDRISEMTSGSVFKFDGESMRSKFKNII